MTRQEIEDEEKRRRVLRDGEVLRVPTLLMDSAQRAVAAETSAAMAQDHRPHFGRLATDEAARRDKMYADADKRLSDRWRAPQTNDAQPVATYATYDSRVASAWRHPR